MRAKLEPRLTERFPLLVERLQNAPPDSDGVEDLRSGSKDWDALLDRWVGGLDLKKGAALAVSGLGDGTHMARLLERLPSGCFVFCAEESESRAVAVLNSGIGRDLLADPRFYLGVGELDEAFFESMSRFPVLECSAAAPVIFSPLFLRSESYYQRFFTEFARQLDFWRKLFGTNVTAAERWNRNTLDNLAALIGAPDLSSLQGLYRDVPMVLASAGPSLDESLDFLREAQERAVILAVNSSFRPLRQAGVVPHFVLAADPFEDTARGFRGVSVEGTRLICPFIVHPEVATRFKGSAFTWSDSNLLASYLRLRLGGKLGWRVREQGTVAACAFDVAKALGCQRLIFTGQDFAARPDGKLHASGSFYEELGERPATLEQCRWLPGNTSDKVPVEEKLYVYLKTFESLIAENASWLEALNTSRLGAQIKGSRYLDFQEASELLGCGASVALERGNREVERRLALPGIEFASCIPILRELQAYLDRVARIALKGALIGEGATGSELAVQSKRLLAKRDQLSDALEADGDFHKILKESGLKYEQLEASRLIRELEEQGLGPAERQARELTERFWAYAEAAFRFNCDIERAMG